ncbi:tyrosine-type recombinase/integrase [Paenibacillus sp. WC2504]|uniref:tyrosine-type recombinase/integrase n=1 Tax=Paenibacillus sp. WC2504 TaxID=3461403 RepID=UPI0040463582
MKVGKILATENKYGNNKNNLNPDYLTELEQDKWDVRKIGIPHYLTRTDYFITFTKIHENFRPLVKRYVKERLIDTDSIRWNTAIQDVCRLNVFFAYLYEKYPLWIDLKELTRSDIEGYFSNISTKPMGGESPLYRNQEPSDYYLWSMVANVENFIYFMQRYEWVEAPLKPVRSLIYQEDRPKLKPREITEYKHVTDYIWNQILDKISLLDPQYVTILLLMEETGLHLIDILNLKLNCLIEGEDGIWLKSERTKAIQVPLRENIAQFVRGQRQQVNEDYPENKSSGQYLFLKYKGKFEWRGKPYLQASVLRQLNSFARENNIRDENGIVYRFSSVAFKHRYGLKQISNGLSIIDVQKLQSNTTPLMAVTYAKIHDLTRQNHWENSLALNAVRLNANTGIVETTNLNDQALENGVRLDWLSRNFEELRLEHGYCIKSPKTHCMYVNQMVDLPCISYKCSSFYIDNTFFEYYKVQITELQTKIEQHKLAGRFRMIEILEPKLHKFLDILNKLNISLS